MLHYVAGRGRCTVELFGVRSDGTDHSSRTKRAPVARAMFNFLPSKNTMLQQYRDETLPALTASLSILSFLLLLASRSLLLDSVGQHGCLHATVMSPGVGLIYAMQYSSTAYRYLMCISPTLLLVEEGIIHALVSAPRRGTAVHVAPNRLYRHTCRSPHLSSYILIHLLSPVLSSGRRLHSRGHGHSMIATPGHRIRGNAKRTYDSR